MTEFPNYNADPTASFLSRTETLVDAAYLKVPEQAMKWAVEGVEVGIIDASELYAFMKEYVEGNDMTSWVRDVLDRRYPPADTVTK